MFTTKNKIIIGALSGLALLMLILGIVFMVNDNDKVEELHYEVIEEAIHKIGENGRFPTDIEEMHVELNHNLADGTTADIHDNVLMVNYYDNYKNLFIVRPVADNLVEIVSIGEDHVYNTSDDVVISIFIELNKNIATITTINNEYCYHRYESTEISKTSCTEKGIVRNQCIICKHHMTKMELSYGHKFDKEGCSATSECIVCKQKVANRDHLFVLMDIDDIYLKERGSCNTPSTYFYRCVYCNLMSSTETFSYVNPDNHLSFRDEKIQLDAYTFIHRISCKDCNKELISAVISNKMAEFKEGMTVKPTIYTLDDAQYSIDNMTWTTEIPSVSEAGNHTIFYKITRDNVTLNGTVSVRLNDVPKIHIDQLPSDETLYLVEEPEFLLSGTVYDSNGINRFAVNNEILSIGENGEWEFEGEFDENNPESEPSISLTLLAMDNDGNTTTKKITIVYVKPIVPIPTNIRYIHTNEKFVNISGRIDNLENFDKLLLDGEKVYVDEHGNWSQIIETKENDIIEVVTEIHAKTGEIVKEIVKVCHCNKEPTATVTEVENNVIWGTIKDTGFDCSTIKEINVYNISHLNGVQLTNCTMNNKPIKNGFNIYTKGEQDIDFIDFEINLDEYEKQEYFEVEITTTHGQNMLYQFTLTWDENKVSKINLVILNQVTKTQTSMDIPLSLVDWIM